MKVDDVIAPLQKLKEVILQCIESDSEDILDFDIQFHLDPFKEDDDERTDYATFEDYNKLLD